MRYFKATITFEVVSGNGDMPEIKEQFLFCQTKDRQPEKEQLQKAFYECSASNTKYLSGVWQEIDELDYMAARKQTL